MIAISPDRRERLQQSQEAEGLQYTLCSDSNLAVARAFGIVFQLSDQQTDAYARHGIDLEAASGEVHHRLPVPSVFLVEAGGIIRWVYSNPDHRVRPDSARLLEAARRFAPRPERGDGETP